MSSKRPHIIFVITDQQRFDTIMPGDTITW